MKMTIVPHETGEVPKLKPIEIDVEGKVTLTEVFNGVVIVTEDDHRFGIAQRNHGLEVVVQGEDRRRCVSIQKDRAGRVFVAADGELVWGEPSLGLQLILEPVTISRATAVQVIEEQAREYAEHAGVPKDVAEHVAILAQVIAGSIKCHVPEIP